MMEKKNQDICQQTHFNEKAIKHVLNHVESSDNLQELANFFKIFGDHTRVRILNALYFSELCVCDLTVILDMNQSAISHQLRILRTAKIVKYRKEGKNVIYSLDDDHISEMLIKGAEHVKEK
jgi:ArsR family transcriptional regulator, lead/cadmium/zinc/bismuth-responsive transcriptional repressor